MNNKCICVLCHDYNEINSKIIKRIKQNIQTYQNNTDLWLMFDIEPNNKHKDDYLLFKNEGYNVWKFDFKQIKQKYPSNFFLLDKTIQDSPFYIGNCHFPMMIFSQQYQYEYYMFYEDDALYTGNINQLYKEVIKEKHDIYFLEPFYSQEEYGRWDWYKPELIHIPEEYFNTYSKVYHHVLNLYIISYKIINVIFKNLLQLKWMGHHELILPSICKFLNLDINFFNKKLNLCYQKFKSLQIEKLIFGILMTKIKNSFFHPIKHIYVYIILTRE